MNALDIKYKTDYITLRDVGSVPKGTIVRRSKWVTDGLGERWGSSSMNNDERSVVMHVKNSDKSDINWNWFEYDDVKEIKCRVNMNGSSTQTMNCLKCAVFVTRNAPKEKNHKRFLILPYPKERL